MRRYCVIGTPVGHSKSPELFERFSTERGFIYGKDVEYVRNEITEKVQLEAFVNELKAGKWDGCNVTMPWKTEMVKYMDELSETARITDAVNTVSAKNGRLYGDSTDGRGMLNAIADEFGDAGAKENVHKSVTLILGCGGAARSIIAEALVRRCGRIIVACRDVEKILLNPDTMTENGKVKEQPDGILDKSYSSESNLMITINLLYRMGVKRRYYGCSVSKTCADATGGQPIEMNFEMMSEETVSFVDIGDTEVLRQAISLADVLINSTPLGMLDGRGDEKKLPIPEEIELKKELLVADCVYNPDETLLIKKAYSSGCKVVKGIRMLEEQARCGVDLLLAE